MRVDPANASELAVIACEVGQDIETFLDVGRGETLSGD
jgi:hypothetical protein